MSSVLSGEASVIQRDQLLAELEELRLRGDLDAWALRAWPKANTLRPADGNGARIAFFRPGSPTPGAVLDGYSASLF